MEDVVDEVLDAPNSDDDEQSDIKSTKNNDDQFDNKFAIANVRNGGKKIGNSAENNEEKNNTIINKTEKDKSSNLNELHMKDKPTIKSIQNDKVNKDAQATTLNNTKKINRKIDIEIRLNRLETLTKEGDVVIKNGQKIIQTKVADVQKERTINEKGNNQSFIQLVCKLNV